MCGIPSVPLALNYAWETVALFITLFFNRNMVSLLMHGAWFSLDAVIVFLFLSLRGIPRKSKAVFWIVYTLSVVYFAVANEKLLLASYVIDFLMAVVFLLFSLFCKIKKGFIAYGIALLKLLGDFLPG